MAIKLPSVNKAPSGESTNGGGGIQSPRKTKLVKAPGFVPAGQAMKRRLIVNLEAEEKCGKNHMAFSYTGGPIYLHSFDIGDEGVVEKFCGPSERYPEGGPFWYPGRPDIFKAEYILEVQPGEGTTKEVQQAAERTWDSFVANYKESIRLTAASEGLVIVDTGTEMWELLRLASFGKLTQVMPHHYGPVNAEMRDLVRLAFEGHNVIFLHKLVDEWENYTGSDGKEKGRKTGRKSRKGFGDIPFLVQCNIQCWREDLEGGGSNFWATVVDCRQNPSINNTVIANDFDTLIQTALE